MRRQWIAVAVAVAVVALAGGAVAVYGRPTPAKAADAFLQATQRGDSAAYEAAFTRKAREAGKQAGMPLRVEVTPAGGGDQRKRLRVGDTHLDGEIAEVTLVDPSAPEESLPLKLKMRKDEGEWRVFAVVAPIAGTGTQVTLDYENPASIPADLLTGMARGWGAKVIGQGLKAIGEGLKTAGDGLVGAGNAMEKEGGPAPAPR